MMNKGIWREQYYTIAACRQGKVEQVYIKSMCGHIMFP